MKEVRRALDDRDTASPFIRTAHGVGYAFAGALERAAVSRPNVTHWILVGTRRVALGYSEHVIGRDPAATVLLDVAGVSRRHTRIVVAERGATLEDLGSKNGTRVADQAFTGRVSLRDGDQIHIGPVLTIYHASASGMSTETIIGRSS